MAKKLYRSRNDRVFTGLAGGIAKYLGIDSTVVRVLLILFEFFTAGLLIVIYFVIALFVPKEPIE
jgi:phage shock protein C